MLDINDLFEDLKNKSMDNKVSLKYQKVKALYDRPGTEGEKQAAKNILKRMKLPKKDSHTFIS